MTKDTTKFIATLKGMLTTKQQELSERRAKYERLISEAKTKAGNAEDVFNSPKSEYTKRLLSVIPQIPTFLV